MIYMSLETSSAHCRCTSADRLPAPGLQSSTPSGVGRAAGPAGRVTGGQEAVDKLGKLLWPIYKAGTRGRHAGDRQRAFRRTYQGTTSQQERLLANNVEQFIQVMTVWREKFYNPRHCRSLAPVKPI
jgi:hypothetical protein